MTTVAANLTSIACDSLISDGTSSFKTSTKIYRVRGGVAGYAGTVSACLKLIAWLQKPNSRKPVFDDDVIATAIILKKDGIWYCDTDLVLMKVEEPFYAIGTGADATRGAMHCGRSPAQAVEIACRIDQNSKLPVVALNL